MRRGGLTLNEPSSPDRIIQTDLISPQQAKTLKRLPFWGDYFTTGRQMTVWSVKMCNLSMENEQCSCSSSEEINTDEMTKSASPTAPC